MYRIRVILLICGVILMGSASAAMAAEFSKNRAIALDASKSLRERIIAIRHLGAADQERAAEPLLVLLTNPSEQEGIRSCAARELADLGGARSQIIPALEVVYKEPGAGNNLMFTILVCLGHMRASEALPLLTQALSDPRAMIRFKASQAIGQLKTDESVRLLVLHMEKEEDRMVRAEMVRALGNSENPLSEKALVQSLVSDPEPLVRWNAALTLKTFTSLSPEARSALIAAQQDPSLMVRETVRGIRP